MQGKPIDANKYATKKTIAQGMLDIALLTANASQLKYVLQLGKKHEFYTVMLTLISSSIVLQVLNSNPLKNTTARLFNIGILQITHIKLS